MESFDTRPVTSAMESVTVPPTLMQQEIELEKDALETAKECYAATVEARGLESSIPGRQMIRQDVEQVAAAIQSWIDEGSSGKAGRDMGLTRFLAQYDADELALITLLKVVKAVGMRDRLMSTVAMEVVADLEAFDLTERLKKANPRQYQRYVTAANKESTRPDSRKMAILKRHGDFLGVWDQKKTLFSWGDSERARVGARLVEIVLETCGFAEKTLKKSATGSSNASYYLTATPEAREWIEHAHEVFAVLHPVRFPMCVVPKPWTDFTGGGYLTGKVMDLVKVSNAALRVELGSNPCPLVFDAVNALQESRWAVNADVLAMLTASLETKQSTSGIPNDLKNFPLPARHDFMDTIEGKDWTDDHKALFATWKKETAAAKEALNRQVSSAFAASTLQKVATRMAAFSAFHFPHQLDWRGRAYPVPAFLQPQGGDLAKGLLKFAGSVALGEHGLKWMAIHGANSFGVDKVTYEDRMAWVREHTEEIRMDAADPARPGALWVKAAPNDNPFQFLAFCFEWDSLFAWVAAGNRHQDFQSYLAGGIDGSCNGLQHFSAILRDEVGGAATNLVPAEKPSDIYALVAEKTRKQMEWDTTSDDPVTKLSASFWLNSGVTRKWTKRNTMTVPYGVSRFGMSGQLWGEIGKEGGETEFFKETDAKHGPAVRYLAQTNWDAINGVVVAARQAMNYLQDVAKVFNKVKGDKKAGAGVPITWTTPDGLLVQQCYRNFEEVRVSIFNMTYRLTLRKKLDTLNTVRQASGSAPNFIHSIDASHMRAVVRRLKAEGIDDFAMVHDSFGTHFGNMQRLAEVTRDEFVKLHSVNLLETFTDEQRTRLSDDDQAKLPSMPSVGTLDLEAVKQSPYFFM